MRSVGECKTHYYGAPTRVAILPTFKFDVSVNNVPPLFRGPTFYEISICHACGWRKLDYTHA